MAKTGPKPAQNLRLWSLEGLQAWPGLVQNGPNGLFGLLSHYGQKGSEPGQKGLRTYGYGRLEGSRPGQAWSPFGQNGQYGS